MYSSMAHRWWKTEHISTGHGKAGSCDR